MVKKDKLGFKLWFNIVLFNLMGGVAWNVENMYFNTFLYNSVYAGASSEALAGTMAPTTAISRMVALSAITAVVTTFIMGTFSDRMKNRKVFIAFGYIAWGIVTGLFGFISRDNIAGLLGLSEAVQILTATVWAVIIMDMIMTFMGSTSNDSAFNAWVTDVTTPKTRPIVETIFTVVGFASTGIVMGIGSFAQAGTISYKSFFVILGAVVVASGLIGLFTLEEPEHKIEVAKSNSYWADLFYGFKPSVIKSNSRLYLALASLCIFSCAFQVFFPYLFVYLQYVVLTDATNTELLSELPTSLIIVAVLAVATLIAGLLILFKIAKKSKVWAFIPGVISLAGGLFVLSTSVNLYPMLVGIAFTFIGYLILTIQLGAAIRDFIPVGMAGRFQGIRMIFFVLIPMVVGPAIGDLACRNAGAVYTDEFGISKIVPDTTMFLYSAIIALLVFIPLIALCKKGFNLEKEENE